MAFSLDSYAMERIQKNGTLIAPLSCCGYRVGKERFCYKCRQEVSVTLRGVRNQIRQTYQWQIFIGAAETKPVATLSCAYCEQPVTTENRQCRCGAYCYLELQRKGDRLELHRDVAMVEMQNDKGIVIVTQEAATDRPINAQPLDVSGFDLKIGELYCPFGHAFSYIGMPNIDENGCCLGHHVQLSAVMVFTVMGIFIERRAHDLSTGDAIEIAPERTRITQLRCHACEHPIVDKTLLCSTCKTHIVDVVQKPAIDLHRRTGFGNDPHIFIEKAPRWAWDTTRPHSAIVMEGDTWGETETLSEIHATETTTDTPMDYDTIFTEYIRLKTLGYKMRPAAERLGISVGKLQYVLKKKKEENDST